eukprot:9384199-Alexandrium_andersonii.AAC.1
MLEAGMSVRALDDWRRERDVSRVVLRAWIAFAESRARAIEAAVGDALRARGAGELQVSRADCSERGLEVSLQELAVWRSRHAVVEHLEFHFGDELRTSIASGSLAGEAGPAVQSALAGRCD